MKVVHRFGWALVAAVAAGCAAGGGEVVATYPEPARVDRRGGAPDSVVIGAILPRSGSEYLGRYGELVLQGLEVAVAEFSESSPRPVALDVVDDGGDPERAALAMARLERRGAVAVIGPLLPQAVAAAAAARGESGPVIIAPLASEVPGAPNVYALNAPDLLGAEALARYAAAEGMRRVAILYPRTQEHRRQAFAFSAMLEQAGGTVVVEVPYDSGTTTFATQLKAILEAAPDAIYVPAPERDVHQIAPQITYYGLAGAGVRVLGGEEWTTPSVRNQVAARYLNGVVAVTPLLESSPALGWSDFVARYEQAQRRSLDNPYPALGYDAIRLVLATLDGDRDYAASDVARAIANVREMRGATGILSVEGRGIVRRPFLVRIEQGELVSVETP